ncbi:MAG: GNAT family N-acetyltransferase [Porphyromonadaceae bacterium]|nr:GNAT family N-acetyltransferase [Porphyromonadaceae bacterium]
MNKGDYNISFQRYEYEAVFNKAAEYLAPYFDPLWLDSVCGDEGWEPMVIEFNNGHKLLFPYYSPTANHLSQPPFTQFIGPHIIPSDRTELTFSDKRNAMMVLLKNLPQKRSYYLQTSPQLTDWLPFKWEGFEQTTRYTNILYLNSPNEKLVAQQCNQLLRRKVRSAKREGYQLIIDADAKDLIPLVNLSLMRSSNEKINYEERLKNLVRTFKKQGKGCVYIATKDTLDNADAAVFMVRNGRRTYYMAGGQSLEKSKNALAFCLYQAICNEISQFGIQEVDFEGSMIKGVEFFFRNFGAVQTPYFALSKGKMGFWSRLKRKFNTK